MSTPNVKQLAEAVAEHLTGWTAEEIASDYPGERDSRARLTHADGGSVFLRFENRGRKVNVSGEWPRSPSGGYRGARDWGVVEWNAPNLAVNISATRPAKTLASDLERRLLGRYVELYAVAIARRDEEAARENRVARLVDRFEEIANAQTQLARKDQQGTGLRLYASSHGGDKAIHGDCRIYDDTTSFDRLSVPNDVAEKIIELLSKEAK